MLSVGCSVFSLGLMDGNCGRKGFCRIVRIRLTQQHIWVTELGCVVVRTRQSSVALRGRTTVH